MSLGLFLYKSLTFLIAPFLGAFFRRRAKSGKENPARITERLAKYTEPKTSEKLIWFHAASVGESQLLLELARRFLKSDPVDATYLFTCQTQTAADLISKTFVTDPVFQGTNAIQKMAPVDTRQTTRRFLHHWQPDLAIFAEGEIWPNQLLELEAREIPAVLVNARMTEKSTLGWMRWRKTANTVFSTYELMIAADVQTKTGLEALSGQTVINPGNLKSALPAPSVDEALLNQLRGAIGDREVLLAASTHAGEEALILDAFPKLSPKPLLVIAPRHPERGDEVDTLISCTKFSASRWSENRSLPEGTEILLADTMGEMGLWYRLARSVYLGGGHAPGVGGHNPLEALRLGKPVLTGPSLFNFSDLSERLKPHGGFTIVEDTEALISSYPPAPVSKDMVEALETDAKGPMSATLAALEPVLKRAGLKS
ncbi:MAG: glycosyltransferase N-terminal domain-containing protein [Pseudomonadota bacterium]